MLPDMIGSANQWHDVYAETGIPPGTPITITNKSYSIVTAWEGPTAPDTGAWDGVDIPSLGQFDVTQVGTTGCWVKSGAQVRVNVQVDTDD